MSVVAPSLDRLADRHLLLMGLRGSGKSTIAPLLASTLKRPWVDLDARVITHLAVPSIAAAFERLGEPAFRTAEAECLRSLLAEPPQIVALGGGSAAVPAVQALLEAPAVRPTVRIAWLDASDEALAARIETAERSAPGTRPRLHRGGRGGGWIDEVRHLRSLRAAAFGRLAEARFETDRGGPAAVAAEIAAWFHDGSFPGGSFQDRP